MDLFWIFWSIDHLAVGRRFNIVEKAQKPHI